MADYSKLGDEFEKRVSALCERVRADGLDPQAATVLSMVTWEELIRVVLTEATEAGMFPPQITLRGADDWQAVYKNGIKVEANHSVSLKRGLEALGIPFEERYFDHDEMNEWGDALKDGSDPFPESLT